MSLVLSHTPLAGLQLQPEGEQGALHCQQLALQLGELYGLTDPLWSLKNEDTEPVQYVIRLEIRFLTIDKE